MKLIFLLLLLTLNLSAEQRAEISLSNYQGRASVVFHFPAFPGTSAFTVEESRDLAQWKEVGSFDALEPNESGVSILTFIRNGASVFYRVRYYDLEPAQH